MSRRPLNVVVTGDIYRGNQRENIRKFAGIIGSVFDDVCPLRIISECTSTSLDWRNTLHGEGQSEFEHLSLGDSLVVGFELNPIDLQLFKERDIDWVNVEIHPIRFLDDLRFSITCSRPNANKFSDQSSKQICRLTAQRFRWNRRGVDIKPRSLLIVGQTLKDKSTFAHGKFHRLREHQDRLRTVTAEYGTVYYKPHPVRSLAENLNFLETEFNAIKISDSNIYNLIADSNIRGVCGLSSSCLHEAPYFDCQVEFLLDPIKQFSVPYTTAQLLETIREKYFGDSSFHFDNAELDEATGNNFLRDIFGYWAYPRLDGPPINSNSGPSSSVLDRIRRKLWR